MSEAFDVRQLARSCKAQLAASQQLTMDTVEEMQKAPSAITALDTLVQIEALEHAQELADGLDRYLT